MKNLLELICKLHVARPNCKYKVGEVRKQILSTGIN